ncbi:hypothetical protein PVK06_048452 [Gossypium arboreum]|uniref:Uncharacterized protein n=1 Tax=Gossypium arboreum TaxID=29729 RepID=A0ABR0MFW6_GOSAR|nr:hypothetical protein PVK06_048452 [Gossypium arboreum]
MGIEIKIDINTISTHLDTPNADDRKINGVINSPSSTIFSLKYNTLLSILFHKLGINVYIDPTYQVQQSKEDDKVTRNAVPTSRASVVFKSFWVTSNEIHATFDA